MSVFIKKPTANCACFLVIFINSNVLFQSVTNRENSLLFCSVGICCLADGKTVLLERFTSLGRRVLTKMDFRMESKPSSEKD